MEDIETILRKFELLDLMIFGIYSCIMDLKFNLWWKHVNKHYKINGINAYHKMLIQGGYKPITIFSLKIIHW